MANISPNAPPHDEPDQRARAVRCGPTEGSERAFRERLGKTGVYKAKGDTGGPMPTGRATAPLVLGRGAKR